MEEKTYKFVIEWEGNAYDCTWSDDTNFEKLSRVISARGFIFNNKNKFCIIKTNDRKNWSNTGGGPEKEDKTFEDTLIREVSEEADLKIKDIQRLGSISVTPRHNPSDDHQQVIFIARVKKINPQTIDPAKGTINKRKFIFPKDFNKHCGWGENGDFQIKKALKKLK